MHDFSFGPIRDLLMVLAFWPAILRRWVDVVHNRPSDSYFCPNISSKSTIQLAWFFQLWTSKAVLILQILRLWRLFFVIMGRGGANETPCKAWFLLPVSGPFSETHVVKRGSSIRNQTIGTTSFKGSFHETFSNIYILTMALKCHRCFGRGLKRQKTPAETPVAGYLNHKTVVLEP